MSRYDAGYETGNESDTSRLRPLKRRVKPSGPPPTTRGIEKANRLVSESLRNGSDIASRAGTDRSDRSGGTDRTARPRERAPSEGGRSRSRTGSMSGTQGKGQLYEEDLRKQKREIAKNKNIVIREPPARGSGASNYGGESVFSSMNDTRSRHSNNTTLSSRSGKESGRSSDVDDLRSHHSSRSHQSSNTITPSRSGRESRHGGESRYSGMDDTRSRHSSSTITPSTHKRTPSVAPSSRAPSARSRRDDVEMLSERTRGMKLDTPEDPTVEEARRRRRIEKWNDQPKINPHTIEPAASVISGASSLVYPGESVDGRDTRMERLSAASRGRSVNSSAAPSNYSRDSRDRHLAVPSYAPSYSGSSSLRRTSARDPRYDDSDDYDDRGYAPPPAAPLNVTIINDVVVTNKRSSSSYRH